MEYPTDHNSIDKLAEALAKAQGKIKAPTKNRIVDFTHNGKRTKYSYADLADVIDAVRAPLSENGLSLIHILEQSDQGFGMRTALLHSSGQKIETWYPLPNPSTMRPQEFGSSITYGRRYSVSLLIGIASEEDDDGAAAAAPDDGSVKKILADARIRTKTEIINQKTEPETPLEELVRLVRFKQLPNELVTSVIGRLTGSDKKSSELPPDELQKVLEYIRMMK